MKRDDDHAVIKILEEQILLTQNGRQISDETSSLIATAVEFAIKKNRNNDLAQVVVRYVSTPALYDRIAMIHAISNMNKLGFHDYSLSKYIYKNIPYDSEHYIVVSPILESITLADVLPDFEVAGQALRQKALKMEPFKAEVDAMASLASMVSRGGQGEVKGGAIYQRFDDIIFSIGQELPVDKVFAVNIDNYKNFESFFDVVGFKKGKSGSIRNEIARLKYLCEEIVEQKERCSSAVEYVERFYNGKRDQMIREIAVLDQQVAGYEYVATPRLLDNAKKKLAEENAKLEKLKKEFSNQKENIANTLKEKN